MREFKTSNINWDVKVKLTDTGRKLLWQKWCLFKNQYPHAASETYEPMEADADGWVRYQLWALMQDFGPHISLGGPIPFETELLIAIGSEENPK